MTARGWAECRLGIFGHKIYQNDLSSGNFEGTRIDKCRGEDTVLLVSSWDVSNDPEAKTRTFREVWCLLIMHIHKCLRECHQMARSFISTEKMRSLNVMFGNSRCVLHVI